MTAIIRKMVPRLLADENFKIEIVRSLLRRDPTLHVLRVQDVPLTGASDEVILAWAASNDYILLTHDIKTVPPIVRKRVAAAQGMPGVIIVHWDTPIDRAVANLLLLLGASQPEELINQVKYLPR